MLKRIKPSFLYKYTYVTIGTSETFCYFGPKRHQLNLDQAVDTHSVGWGGGGGQAQEKTSDSGKLRNRFHYALPVQGSVMRANMDSQEQSNQY
jgi:hypothetical protein